MKRNFFNFKKVNFFFNQGIISLHDAAGTFLDANRKIGLLGWDLEKLKSKDPYKFYYLGDRARVYHNSHIRTTHEIQYYELRVIDTNGKYKWVYCYSYSFKNGYMLTYSRKFNFFERLYLSIFKRNII